MAKVERWGGNSNHKRRVVFMGSLDLARDRFKKLARDLRQGVVELFDDNGVVIERHSGPRLRTRW